METNKILLGGLTGAVTLFLLKWIVYGWLLLDYISKNLNPTALRAMQDYVIWAMILAALAFGFLLSLIFSWSGTKGMVQGAKVAAIFGFLYTISMDLTLYGTSTRFLSFPPVLVNIVINTIMMAIAGIAVGCVMDMKKKAA